MFLPVRPQLGELPQAAEMGYSIRQMTRQKGLLLVEHKDYDSITVRGVT